jgi:5-methylcytosine-specific restriction endonuclease McrA
MTGDQLGIVPAGPYRCLCVRRHVPEPQELHRHHVWPLGEGGPDIVSNLRYLCPSSHSNTHKLWRAYQAHGGEPPWGVRKAYGVYVRQLVSDGWSQAHRSKGA